MEEANETLWRSIDSSSSDVGEYFRSPTKSSDGSTSFVTPLATPRKIVPVEEELLDALRNLQIASVKKYATTRAPDAIEPQPLIIDATELNNTIGTTIAHEPDTSGNTKEGVEQAQSTMSVNQAQGEATDVPTEEEDKPQGAVADTKNTEDTEAKEGDKQGETVVIKSIEAAKEEHFVAPIAPAVLENMKRAVKPMFKSSNTKKVTVGVSPMLHTRSRSRLPKTASLNQLNQTRNNNNNKSRISTVSTNRSSSLKRQATRNVVATIVSMKDGIKLKEEKIANFGIPVKERKKKRTEAVPFSFADRSRSTQRETQKQPMRDSKSQNQEKAPAMVTSKKFNEKKFNRSLLTTTKQLVKTFATDESVNKENVTMNKLRMPTGPPKLVTDRRVRERREFDEKVRQRERELEEMRAQVEQRKLQRERMSELEMRRKMETRAKPVPLFKVPAPVRLRKPLTEPQSPAWALKAKKA